jgi:hypothetical protein
MPDATKLKLSKCFSTILSAMSSITVLDFLMTWYLRFGRLKEAENMTGFFIFSCSIMSCETLGVAVAVSAMIGTFGNRSRKTFKRLHQFALRTLLACKQVANRRQGNTHQAAEVQERLECSSSLHVERLRTCNLAGSHGPTACTIVSQHCF